MVNRILLLMAQRNINAATLTKELNLANSSITDWKKGKAKPSVEAIMKIADFFNVSTDYLLGRTIITKEGINMPDTKQKAEAYRSLISDEGINRIKLNLIPLINNYGYENLAKDIGLEISDIKHFLSLDISIGYKGLSKLDKILLALDTNIYQLLNSGDFIREKTHKIVATGGGSEEMEVPEEEITT